MKTIKNDFCRCTVHSEIYAVHLQTNALINLVKSFKIYIIVYLNVNLKLLTKLLSSAFVCWWVIYINKNELSLLNSVHSVSYLMGIESAFLGFFFLNRY